MTRRPRFSVVFFALCCVSLMPTALQPASAGGDDFQFGNVLAERGRHTGDASWFTLARRVFDGMLSNARSSDEQKDLARYGLASLKNSEALAAASRTDVPYEKVKTLFQEAITDIEEFSKKYPKHPNATEARLKVGQARLAFVQWARDSLLSDNAAMKERGTSEQEVAEDARTMVDETIRYFDPLRKGWDDFDTPDNSAQTAQFYWVLCQYYRALVFPDGSSDKRQALVAADKHLDDFTAFFDGYLVGIFAQDIYGLVKWEQAKEAQEEQEQVAAYRAALGWFVTCIDTEHVDAETLKIIARGYHHIAQVCLDAGRIGGYNFLNIGADFLKRMLVEHPTAGQTDDGIRALIEWSKIEFERERVDEAIRLANLAGEKAVAVNKPYLENRAGRQLDIYVTRGSSGPLGRSVGPAVLEKVANSQFMTGRWSDAIRAYQRVIGALSGSTDDLMNYGIPAWRRIADAYANMGDLLAASLAAEPIHEAWIDGRIPRTGEENDPNLLMAGNARNSAKNALKELYQKTGAEVFKKRFTEIQDSFERDYPKHPIGQQTVWVAAMSSFEESRKLRLRKDSRWKRELEKAETGFTTVSRDSKSPYQHAAYVMLARCKVTLKDWNGAIKLADDASRFWDSAAVKAAMKEHETIAQRVREARGKVLYWKSIALIEAKQWDKALALLENFSAEHGGLDEVPYLSGALGMKVEAYLGKGDMAGVDKYFRQLLRKYPNYFRLPQITFELARHHESAYSALEEEFRTETKKLWGTPEDRASGLADKLDKAERDENVIAERLIDLNGSIRKLKELIQTYDEAEKDPDKQTSLTKKNRDDAVAELAVQEPERDRLNAELKEAKAKKEDLRDKVAAVRKQIDALKQQMYTPLVKAADYYKSWDDVLKESAPQERTAKNVGLFAYRFYYATVLRPETRSNWIKARDLYEDYLKFEDLTEEEQSAAKAKLGKIYSQLAKTSTKPAERRQLLLKAVELLQAAVAKLPANNDLVVGHLAGRYVILPWKGDSVEQGQTFFYPLPPVKDVAEFRKAVDALGTPAGTPIPTFESNRQTRTYRDVLRRFQTYIREEEDATLARTVKMFSNAGFDSNFYRRFANSGSDFRLALARAYAESGREEDVAKAFSLAGSLLRSGNMRVTENTEEFWDAQIILLTTYYNAADRLIRGASGSVPPEAKDMLENVVQHIQSLNSQYPLLGDEAREGTCKEIEGMLERLNALRQRSGMSRTEVAMTCK